MEESCGAMAVIGVVSVRVRVGAEMSEIGCCLLILFHNVCDF